MQLYYFPNRKGGALVSKKFSCPIRYKQKGSGKLLEDASAGAGIVGDGSASVIDVSRGGALSKMDSLRKVLNETSLSLDAKRGGRKKIRL